MSPTEIKKLLTSNGIKMVDIATDLSCTRGAISNVIYRRSVSAHIQTEVAKAIGKSVKEVFES